MPIEKFHAVIPSEESRIYAFKGKTMHNPVKWTGQIKIMEIFSDILLDFRVNKNTKTLSIVSFSHSHYSATKSLVSIRKLTKLL